MKTLLLRTLLLIAIGLMLWVIFAGVTLEIENSSGEQLTHIQIQYFKGQLDLANLPDGTVKAKWLWKIGEGATFHVQWSDPSGAVRHAKLPVYFRGHTGFETVRIRLLSHGRSELRYRNETYAPSSQAAPNARTAADLRSRLVPRRSLRPLSAGVGRME